MNINFVNADIKTAPQGYTIVSAFSADLDCGAGINRAMDDMFSITARKDAVKRFKSKNLAKIDNLYMLLVKDTSYDAPNKVRLEKALKEFCDKCMKNGIKKVAMPALCTGKNGITLDELFELLDSIFFGTDIDILMYVPEKR